MLARRLTFDVEDLLPLVDAAQLLGLAVIDDADIELTDEGRRFVKADIDASKSIFARQAKLRAPLVRRSVAVWSRPRTGVWVKDSSLTCFGAASPKRMLVGSSISRLTGAATASFTTSMRTPANCGWRVNSRWNVMNLRSLDEDPARPTGSTPITIVSCCAI